MWRSILFLSHLLCVCVLFLYLSASVSGRPPLPNSNWRICLFLSCHHLCRWINVCVCHSSSLTHSFTACLHRVPYSAVNLNLMHLCVLVRSIHVIRLSIFFSLERSARLFLSLSLSLWRRSFGSGVGLSSVRSIFHATCRISAYSHLHKYMYLCTRKSILVLCVLHALAFEFYMYAFTIVVEAIPWASERKKANECVHVHGPRISFSSFSIAQSLYRMDRSLYPICHKPKSNSIACLIILFIL